MKQIYAYCLLFLFCAASALGQVQPRGVFLQKIVNPHQEFDVLVEVDREDALYTAGDILQTYVTSKNDGYLYLFYRDADAQVAVLFPNKYQKDNFIRGGERVPVPKPGADFQMRIGPPFGHELLKAVVSKKPFPFIDGMDVAKFRIADTTPVDDNAGNAFNNAITQTEERDWAEGEINIRTVPRPQGGDGNCPNTPSSLPVPDGPQGTKKMHLILAADISSSDTVGSVVQSDTYNLRELIENNIAGGRLNIVDLQKKRKGELLTKDDILREIRNLNVNSNDTIFFFYSGHGAYDSEVAQRDAEGGQYFALASYIKNKETEKPVFRYEIMEAMKSKNARLSVLISDCCNEQADVPAHVRPTQPPQSRGEMKGLRALFEILFFEAEGVVDITASEKGTYGFIYPRESREENGKSKGSVFTWNLCKKLETETYASKDWEQVFKSVREETNKDYQQVFAQHIQDGRIQQKELKPHAFILPESR